MRLINASRLILCSLWLGAAVFFSAVVAPSAFGVLRSFNVSNASQIAGDIVTRNLGLINISGLVVGLFLLLTLFIGRHGRAALITEFICASLIIACTSVNRWLLAPRLRDLRVAIALPFEQVPANDGRRIPVRINQAVLVVICIQMDGGNHLFHVIHTSDGLRLLFGGSQSWQQHRRQNGDDGDHHQQFNECECPSG